MKYEKKYINYVVGFVILAMPLSFTYAADSLIYLTNTISINVGLGPFLTLIGTGIKTILGLLIFLAGYDMRSTNNQKNNNEIFDEY